MGRWYLLDENKQPYRDPLNGGTPMTDEMRRVGRDTVGEVEISTVFLGLDHSWNGPRPVLYESMIFGGEHDQYQRRYHTWDEAAKGHAALVKWIEDGGCGQWDWEYYDR